MNAPISVCVCVCVCVCGEVKVLAFNIKWTRSECWYTSAASAWNRQMAQRCQGGLCIEELVGVAELKAKIRSIETKHAC